ncbi:3-carboxy-cis,cis-muconate cycloisomerase [Microvirga brassicacearum]|uniref:3-carboxy-cis,cis-muconate cycloisomerase n=1 Tax=Microvirga brassicacearum TaxID=2580413 RepID=A0A5N3P887_9HYPH|nr:3-carboxy-cis,cis-muconate cycloisomerase [Microvirga brassicacearum]KAB0265861.1 3-carboxy-cis,cis-muconate cycloisomerase [Microvirga brassicacearum]
MTTNPTSPLLHALVGDEEVGALFSNEAELAAMLRVEAALAEAEAESGLIAPAAARAIGKACQSFQADWRALAEGLAQDGVVVPALVTQLRAAVGEPHAGAVHLGATSQDVIDSSLILRLKDVTDVFLQRLDHLILALEALKIRDGTIPLMAHTRMQQALPFTAADKLDTWIAPLKRHRARLLELMPHLLVVQLGGPIGTRAELGGKGDAVAAVLAARLGLRLAPAWHSQRDRLAEFGAFLSLLSGTLGKLGQDMALMAQNEIGSLRLSGGGGSSAMAHKSNPVGAEVLVALARFNAGLLGTLHQALVHENERSGAAWTLEWMVLPQMTIAAAAGLQRAQTLVAGATFIALE